MNIAVYLGAASGNNEKYKNKTIELGDWIAKNNDTLIYGAGNVGLMGDLANEVLSKGGKVIGIIPEFLLKLEIGHRNLTELILVETMSQRKRKMFELGEAFIALPGGAGTLEEIVEVISWSRLGRNPYPCVLYNLDGFFDPLKDMYEKMVQEGFLEQKYVDKILFSTSIPEIEEFIKTYTPPEVRSFEKV